MVEALRPEYSTGVEPWVDNNVMKVTPNCLFMRTSSAILLDGRRSMSWWAVFMSVFIIVFLFFADEWVYFSKEIHVSSV
jgi:hypothetical protein